MASVPTKSPARPYKDFLTPFLHRNFVNAALVTLGVCYLEAGWIAGPLELWSWIPLGLAGIRTLLLFICALAIFVLRVANMHVGKRTQTSQFQDVFTSVLTARAVQTLAWYSFSAWFFGEVYIWSQPVSASLSAVDPGRSYERPKLNERPVFLRTLFVFTGIVQAIYHIYSDKDSLDVPVPKTLRSSDDATQGAAPLPLAKIKTKLFDSVNQTLQRTLVALFFGVVLYLVGLRQYAWYWSFSMAKNVFNLPRNSRPATFPPFIGDLLGRFLIESFLLNMLWETVNLTFTEYVSQAPLKNGQPLTNGTKDPNGSLLAGLKAKKDVPRTFAFWELLLIAASAPERRLAMFKDIDREGGSTWSEVFSVSLGELHGVVKRIQDFQNPPVPFQAKEAEQPIHHLPKISAPLKQDEKIFTAPPPLKGGYVTAAAEFGKFAKAHGQSPVTSVVSPRAKQLISSTTDAVLSKQQQEMLSTSGLLGQAKLYALKFLGSQFGGPFRQRFRNRVNAIVFGSPSTNASIVVDAVTALTKLAVQSLKEDTYGRVHQDVPNLIRTFTSTITTVQGFLATLPPHWTDIDFKSGPDGTRAKVKETDALLVALRDGLQELVVRFEPYNNILGLKIAEIRKAKEAAGMNTPGLLKS